MLRKDLKTKLFNNYNIGFEIWILIVMQDSKSQTGSNLIIVVILEIKKGVLR